MDINKAFYPSCMYFNFFFFFFFALQHTVSCRGEGRKESLKFQDTLVI